MIWLVKSERLSHCVSRGGDEDSAPQSCDTAAAGNPELLF